jgi:hypothetical protein
MPVRGQQAMAQTFGLFATLANIPADEWITRKPL